MYLHRLKTGLTMHMDIFHYQKKIAQRPSGLFCLDRFLQTAWQRPTLFPFWQSSYYCCCCSLCGSVFNVNTCELLCILLFRPLNLAVLSSCVGLEVSFFFFGFFQIQERSQDVFLASFKYILYCKCPQRSQQRPFCISPHWVSLRRLTT